MRLTVLILIALLLQGLILPQSVHSADELVTFEDPAQREMYFALLKEYRCLKCQNQNLADSAASLANDLRREIRDQILDGKSADDIDEYLVSRYGEFVLYRPRFGAKTAILWIGPFVLLALALGAMVLMLKQRKRLQADGVRAVPIDDARQQLEARLEKAKRLLEE